MCSCTWIGAVSGAKSTGCNDGLECSIEESGKKGNFKIDSKPLVLLHCNSGAGIESLEESEFDLRSEF